MKINYLLVNEAHTKTVDRLLLVKLYNSPGVQPRDTPDHFTTTHSFMWGLPPRAWTPQGAHLLDQRRDDKKFAEER